MDYRQNFAESDRLIDHLISAAGISGDDIIRLTYPGLIAVAAVTAYELAIKSIFFEFARKKHKVLHEVTRKEFSRINGRVKYKNIREDYTAYFGDKYKRKFEKFIERSRQNFLRTYRGDFVSDYNNLIEWRNSFVHNGVLPTTATVLEAKESYERGKRVIQCLYDAMQR